MEHPKAIGDRSTLAIMTALSALGYGLYVPFGENTRCDLIIEKHRRLLRVQCKTGRLRRGTIWFRTVSSYAHHPNPKLLKRDYVGDVDCFGVFCPETGGVYLVPLAGLPFRSTAALRVDPPANNQANRIRWAAEYEVGRLATGGLRGPSGA